jgi:multidrug efflux pump subunit AcrB
MNGMIRASLRNPYAVTVFALTVVVLGALCITMIPVDILPVFKSPAVQTLTFYNGMSAANVSHDITNRMERWTGQANGTARQESRSIIGASIVRNYFQGDVDPNGALTQVNSLALAAIPNLPPGTLPPVVLPFDPTSTTPIGIVALDTERPLDPKNPQNDESILYDVGRYQVRNMIMGISGAVAPVVYGGKIRAVMAYLDRVKMQARGLSPLDVMRSLDNYNLFLPTGDVKLGDTDYAVDSNSMFERVDQMGEIPLRTERDNSAYLRDVATPKDASFIQTNVVRVNGKRQVYIPVFRQLGASTLKVIDTIRAQLADMQSRLVPGGINLKLVMDQSVYVKKSIESLVQEGVLGAVLCSAVILMFLGEWRMTVIAILTLPLSVLASLVGLFFTGNTINVMTLAGLALAIGPMIDISIICLENTHRHLGMGVSPEEGAYLGASEVALPALVASLCTLLVLSPLALMPGLGQFLFRPMALAVTFAMVAAYVLSQTFVPSRAARWLKPHTAHAGRPTNGGAPGAGHGTETFEIEPARTRRGGWVARTFRRWEGVIEAGVRGYTQLLEYALRWRVVVAVAAVGLLVAVLALLGTRLRREFFPEVDAGAFEIYVRAPSGLRIEETEKRIAEVEAALRRTIDREDLELFISELGVTPDWSAAYTPNAGPMDAIVRVQLSAERRHSAQEYVRTLRASFAREPRFADLEFAFDAGGMIRSAMNEGRSSPINIRVTGKDQKTAHRIASAIRGRVAGIPGVVDSRVIQRLDYPQLLVKVDRVKAADLGLTQDDVMRNLVAALNSSIQFNKKNFWIDPVSKNQYYVGVSYPEDEIRSLETLLDIPVTSPKQELPVPLRNLVSLTTAPVPTEVTHYNIQPTIDLTMGVEGRDLGHVADDVARVLDEFGRASGEGTWAPYDPDAQGKSVLGGSKIVLSGEYERMRNTFRDLGIGLVLATMLIYFLMVALFKSYITPVVILSAVPIGLVGVVTLLYATGTAISVQSLLGVIFMVGIIVSNTVLMIDFAQNLRAAEGLTPNQAIRKAASIRVRPVVMTALAAFFALIPMALALERGSEANAPLGRAVIGGLVAGLVTTLFVVPALYSLLVRDPSAGAEHPAEGTVSEAEPTPGAGWT